jgi:predicted GNAT family N-acyltransferase
MIRVDVADYQVDQKVIHSLRQEVFVKEQRIPAALEADQWDALSIHVLARHHRCAIATGRLLPDGRIGRVAVRRSMRCQGVGRLVMERLLQAARQQGHRQISLSAQCYAVDFYQKLGFCAEGDVYVQMGIEHIKMIKLLTTSVAPTCRPQLPEICSAQRRSLIFAAT